MSRVCLLVVSFAVLYGCDERGPHAGLQLRRASLECPPVAARTFYLTRHAEKAPDPGDGNPSLSAAGELRAEALRARLEVVELGVLYASQYKRTQETLAPVGAAQGLSLEVRSAGDMTGLAEELLALPAGTHAAVAGHSNTVPLLMAALGVVDGPAAIPENDFGDLFILRTRGGEIHWSALRYGAPLSPAPPPLP